MAQTANSIVYVRVTVTFSSSADVTSDPNMCLLSLLVNQVNIDCLDLDLAVQRIMTTMTFWVTADSPKTFINKFKNS